MKSAPKSKLEQDFVEWQPLPLRLRGFVPPPAIKKFSRSKRKSDHQASNFTLVFDTETETDAGQTIRIGTYVFYKDSTLKESGVFYNPGTLTNKEMVTVKSYTERKSLRLRTVTEFVDEVFYGMAYDLRAAIVGFNLPYDLSRLAIRWGPARGKTMRGGFTFQLSADRWKPRVQVKHLSARAALIQFTKPRPRFDTRGMRKRGISVAARRGAFIDVKTLAAALTSRSFTLASSADFLGTEHRKQHTDEHGGPITEAYLDYATQDVLVTWDCYCALLEKLSQHGLNETSPSQILSEASIGKGYLREMNIRPWRKMQPDFPNWLIGAMMSSYYGGRSEVHLRRMVSQVLYCDFLSMYPTVCTLMRLWEFVIAKGMAWHDSTSKVRKLLNQVTLKDMQAPETWRNLTTVVQILPDDDILPVRAKYDNEAQATIGLNHLKSKVPLWYTLADCFASKLLSAKPVKIQRAITFEAGERQDDLRSISIAGNHEYNVDPRSEDFFRCD